MRPGNSLSLVLYSVGWCLLGLGVGAGALSMGGTLVWLWLSMSGSGKDSNATTQPPKASIKDPHARAGQSGKLSQRSSLGSSSLGSGSLGTVAGGLGAAPTTWSSPTSPSGAASLRRGGSGLVDKAEGRGASNLRGGLPAPHPSLRTRLSSFNAYAAGKPTKPPTS